MKRLRALAALAAFSGAPAISLAASSPFGIATPDSPAGNGVTGLASPLLLPAIHLQTLFYQKLTSALDAFSSDPHAGLWLIGLSFLYGIFHAVGPGHGKAVISSYVLATGERLRQATVMSVVASLLQALSAIAIIFVATRIMDATATEITFATDSLELGSYGLVTLLGLTLAASKGRLLADAWRGERASSSAFACEDSGVRTAASRKFGGVNLGIHRHGASCGCLAVNRLATAKPEATMKERLQAIASIGVRPCSGALIVLVFALSRHLAPAGIISVFAMAVGTAVTVSIIAALAVLARGFLARLAFSSQWMNSRLAASLEFGAACTVLLFGMMMLIGLIAADGLL